MSLPELSTTPLSGDLPFEPDAVVREQDTWLVLGGDAVVTAPDADTPELLERAAEFEPLEPGSVVARGGDPVELLAVVHDLDRDPTWRVAWVEAALAEVMRELHARGASGVALPVLGGVHGDLHPIRFRRLLQDAVESSPPWALQRICLQVPRGVDPRTVRDVRRLWGEA